MKKMFWFLMSFFLFASTLSFAWSADSSDLDRERLRDRIMRPSVDTILRWQSERLNAAAAYTDPAITKSLQQSKLEGMGGSKSLLQYLTYDPDERNQGYCGNCWNWAGTGVVEVALSTQQGIYDRLSTQYLNSCKMDNFACCGGTLEKYASWYGRVGMFFPWSNGNASFADAESGCNYGSSVTSCAGIQTDTNYPIRSITPVTVQTYGIGEAAAIANIKNVLHQNKAIFFGFYLPDDSSWNHFYSFWDDESENALFYRDTCGMTYTDEGGGHAVLLVGYDDTAPDPANHYWLILNSWGGPANRPNGLYRIPMHMNYDCTYQYYDETFYAFFWQTLDIDFESGGSECNYSVLPNEENFYSSGGEGLFKVSASNAGCAWTASSQASWISLTSGASGSGNGTVTYSVSVNTGDARTGTLNIAGKTVTVTQDSAALTTNILENPDFENGDDGAWFSTGWVIWELPCYTFGGLECAHKGSWAAWLGGYDYMEFDYLAQDFKIPSTAKNATLRFWYGIETEEEELEPYDTLEIGIYRASDDYYKDITVLSNADATDDWIRSASFDISEFIGQDVAVEFFAITDESLITNFIVDDVELLFDSTAYYAENGIWKCSANEVNFYLQKYQAGSAVVVAFVDGVLTAFLDPNYKDGISCTQDILGQNYSLTLSTAGGSAGTLTAQLPTRSFSVPVSLTYPDNGETGPSIPTNAIWHNPDGSIKFYLQKYDTGSCVIVLLAAGRLTAHLDPDFTDGISVQSDILGQSCALSLNLTGSTTGVMTLNCPHISGTFNVSFKYPENS